MKLIKNLIALSLVLTFASTNVSAQSEDDFVRTRTEIMDDFKELCADAEELRSTEAKEANLEKTIRKTMNDLADKPTMTEEDIIVVRRATREISGAMRSIILIDSDLREFGDDALDPATNNTTTTQSQNSLGSANDDRYAREEPNAPREARPTDNDPDTPPTATRKEVEQKRQLLDNLQTQVQSIEDAAAMIERTFEEN